MIKYNQNMVKIKVMLYGYRHCIHCNIETDDIYKDIAECSNKI